MNGLKCWLDFEAERRETNESWKASGIKNANPFRSFAFRSRQNFTSETRRGDTFNGVDARRARGTYRSYFVLCLPCQIAISERERE